MDVLVTIAGWFFDVIIIGVIWKVIIAHSLADYMVKYAKKWLAAKPQRQQVYDALLHSHRRNSVG